MLVLVQNTKTNDYFTIYRRDIEDFLGLKNFFKTEEFNFKIISDRNEIKEILEKSFTSGNRGGEYNPDNVSATQIAYKLFPLNIGTDKFLLRWMNDTPIQEQDSKNDKPLKMGTYLHKILELYLTNKEDRKKDKPLINMVKTLKLIKKPSKLINKVIDDKILSDIRKYIQIANIDKEILNKIDNFNELKEELEYLAINCLKNFIKEELMFTDMVYSELFLSVDNYLQGSIDYIGYSNGNFSIIDFKTTSAESKKTGKPKFKSSSELAPFARQLAIYNSLIKKSNMTHCFGENKPEFYIYQIHLVSQKYKKFKIPLELVEVSEKAINKIIKWYWSIRNNEELNYQEEFPEYITL